MQILEYIYGVDCRHCLPAMHALTVKSRAASAGLRYHSMDCSDLFVPRHVRGLRFKACVFLYLSPLKSLICRSKSAYSYPAATAGRRLVATVQHRDNVEDS